MLYRNISYRTYNFNLLRLFLFSFLIFVCMFIFLFPCVPVYIHFLHVSRHMYKYMHMYMCMYTCGGLRLMLTTIV